MKIEVGMLAEVINIERPHNSHFIGRRGVVVRIRLTLSKITAYVLDFEEESQPEIGFIRSNLRIINPDSEPADEDWQEDLKRWLDKKVTA